MSEIIGRDEALANVLDVVLGAGRERAAVIEGAPGIGKTVLLDAAIDESRRQGHLVLVSRPAEADRRIALLGLHDLLAPVAADALRVLPGPQRERLEAALSRDSSLPDHSVAEPQLGLAVAIVNALRGLAQRRRLVVAIDDVQWLDRSSSSLLDVALRRLFDDEVRFVSTRRSGTRHVGHGLALARIYGDRLRTIGLDGLALGALQRLIAIRLARSLPRPALLRLHAATGGNPFHAIELARALGDAESPGAAFDTAPPPDVWALLAHRIGGLPRVARDVLGLVALTTRPSIALLADTLERPLQDIEAAVDAALETGLLVEEPAGLALAHPLIDRKSVV
jgi:Predicted ATPase